MDALPTGCWDFFGNDGCPATIKIESIRGNIVTGWLWDDKGEFLLIGADGAPTATWESESRQIRFSRAMATGEVQTFTGYLFDHHLQIGKPHAAMAGFFTSNKHTGAHRPHFGWFAVHTGPQSA